MREPLLKMDREKSYPPAWMAWSVWGIGALFYLMGFYQRVAPAVMTAELMREFKIGACRSGESLGFLLLFLRSDAGPNWPPGRFLGTPQAPDCRRSCSGPRHFYLCSGRSVLFWANLGRASHRRICSRGLCGLSEISKSLASPASFCHRLRDGPLFRGVRSRHGRCAA